MSEIKVKVVTEKKLSVPELSIRKEYDEHCIVDDQTVSMHCNDIPCEECICNIENFKLLADSQNLQLL